MYDLDCITSQDGRSITIVVSAQKKICVQGLIKILAHFLKYLIETNNISYDEVKLKDTDRAKIRVDK